LSVMDDVLSLASAAVRCKTGRERGLRPIYSLV
jgi:hypothetical protein